MVMIGIDPHKRTHTAVAIDDREVVVAERLVQARSGQVRELLGWADTLAAGSRTAANREPCVGLTVAVSLGIHVTAALQQTGLAPISDHSPRETLRRHHKIDHHRQEHSVIPESSGRHRGPLDQRLEEGNGSASFAK